MPGPNFIEPGFGNIVRKKDSYVEGMLHEISNDDFKRIVASEGEDYLIEDVSIETDSGPQLSKTLIYKSNIKELRTSRRYLRLIVTAAKENNLSVAYIDELLQKKICILSSIFRALFHCSLFLGKKQSTKNHKVINFTE